jgi:hypothetical protein
MLSTRSVQQKIRDLLAQNVRDALDTMADLYSDFDVPETPYKQPPVPPLELPASSPRDEPRTDTAHTALASTIRRDWEGSLFSKASDDAITSKRDTELKDAETELLFTSSDESASEPRTPQATYGAEGAGPFLERRRTAEIPSSIAPTRPASWAVPDDLSPNPLTPPESGRASSINPSTPLKSSSAIFIYPPTPLASSRASSSNPSTPLASSRASSSDPSTPLASSRASSPKPRGLRKWGSADANPDGTLDLGDLILPAHEPSDSISEPEPEFSADADPRPQKLPGETTRAYFKRLQAWMTRQAAKVLGEEEELPFNACMLCNEAPIAVEFGCAALHRAMCRSCAARTLIGKPPESIRSDFSDQYEVIRATCPVCGGKLNEAPAPAATFERNGRNVRACAYALDDEQIGSFGPRREPGVYSALTKEQHMAFLRREQVFAKLHAKRRKERREKIERGENVVKEHKRLPRAINTVDEIIYNLGGGTRDYYQESLLNDYVEAAFEDLRRDDLKSREKLIAASQESGTGTGGKRKNRYKMTLLDQARLAYVRGLGMARAIEKGKVLPSRFDNKKLSARARRALRESSERDSMRHTTRRERRHRRLRRPGSRRARMIRIRPKPNGLAWVRDYEMDDDEEHEGEDAEEDPDDVDLEISDEEPDFDHKLLEARSAYGSDWMNHFSDDDAHIEDAREVRLEEIKDDLRNRYQEEADLIGEHLNSDHHIPELSGDLLDDEMHTYHQDMHDLANRGSDNAELLEEAENVLLEERSGRPHPGIPDEGGAMDLIEKEYDPFDDFL